MLLTIDTASQMCFITLGDEAHFVFKAQKLQKSHSHIILPLIHALLKENGFALTDLTGICVSSGPGSFVGVRLGVAVAQGLAYALGLPLYGISSLQILAQSAHIERGLKSVTIVQDAHMGDLYVGSFEFKNGIMQPGVDELSCKADSFVPPKDAVLDQDILPEAIHMLSQHTIKHTEALAPEQTLPVYLRGDSLWKKSDANLRD